MISNRFTVNESKVDVTSPTALSKTVDICKPIEGDISDSEEDWHKPEMVNYGKFHPDGVVYLDCEVESDLAKISLTCLNSV